MAENIFDMPPESAGFDARGAWLITRLMSDSRCGFTNIIHPAAIVGNLGGESRLTAIQEVSPIAGRGGFGWEQATGPRRVAFENFATQHNWKTTDDEANYEFLIWELCDDPNVSGDGSENRALRKLKETTTLEAAVYTFEVVFERPSSTSDVGSRIKYAQRALAYISKSPMPSAPPGPTPSGLAPSEIATSDSDEAAEELNRQELNRLRISEAVTSETGKGEAKPALDISAVSPTSTVSETKTTTVTTKSSSDAAPPPISPPSIQVVTPGPIPSEILAKIPWWVLPGLGVFVMTIFAGALTASCFMENDTLRTQMFSYAAAGFTTALGFFFGSSTGSREKDSKGNSPVILTGGNGLTTNG